MASCVLQRLRGPRTEGNAETHVTENLCSKAQGREPPRTTAAKQRQGSHPRTALRELSPAPGQTALQRPDLQASLRQLRAPQSTRAARGEHGSPRGSDVVLQGLCSPAITDPSPPFMQTCLPWGAALPPLHRPRPQVLSCARGRPAQSQGRAERLWVGAGWSWILGRRRGGGGGGGHSEPNRQAQAGVQTRTGSHPMAESVLRAKRHQQFSKRVITSTSTLQAQSPHMMGGGTYGEERLCETARGGEKESEITSLWVSLFT